MDCPQCGTTFDTAPANCPRCERRLAPEGLGSRLASFLRAEHTPLGIRAVALLEGVFALYLAVVGAEILTGRTYGFLEYGWLLGGIYLGFAALTLVKVYGFWRLRTWAFSIAMVQYVIAFLVAMVIVMGDPTLAFGVMASLVALWAYVLSKRNLFTET